MTRATQQPTMAFNLYKFLLEDDDDDDNDLHVAEPPDGVVLVLLDYFATQPACRLKYRI